MPLAGASGGALLALSAGVHLDLFATGYDRIPAIGALFVLQAAAAVVLGAAGMAAAVRTTTQAWRWRTGVWTAACAFAAATVGGYALSRWVGLFGFHEQPSTAGIVAGIAESGAFVAYGGLAVFAARRSGLIGGPGSAGPRRAMRGAMGAVAAALLSVTLVGGIGSGASATGHLSGSAGPSKLHSPRSPAIVHVVISNYDYLPARVTAHAGEIIAVTNHDQVTHTMTAVPGSKPYGGFNTGYVDPGRTVRIRAPKTPGVYRFYCSIHNFMKGVLVVTK